MNPLFGARQLGRPGGLIGSILEQQQPSANVTFGPPLIGADHLIMEYLLTHGLGERPSGTTMLNRAENWWPMPKGIIPDAEPSPSPMSEQMRAVPFLNEIGALLDRQR